MPGPSTLLIDRSRFLRDVETLVACESPTADVDACDRALALVVDAWADHTGCRPEIAVVDGRSHAVLRPSGGVKVLILGHIDTVWPLDTLARWRFHVDGDRATGPGIFDMKAGLVMAMQAVATLGRDSGVGMLVTTDEETGSATSQVLIHDVARDSDAVLVLEPSAPGGAVKQARKGVSLYEARIQGRAAHAGLEPHKGINALTALAQLVPQVSAIAATDQGTTVTPTIARAGTTMNTVPAEAMFRIDVRATQVGELDRVGRELGRLRPMLDGATVAMDHLGTRPPLEARMSASLLDRHNAVCRRLGIELPPPTTSGGGSDGNFTAGVGVPTLDGLGAVGDGAHAEGEHISIAATLQGAEVLAVLLHDLLDGGSGSA